MKKIDTALPSRDLYPTGETDIERVNLIQVNLSSMVCDDLEGWDGRDGGREAQGEGIYVYLQLIHIVVQKLTQHCKAIILQWKNNEVIKRQQRKNTSTVLTTLLQSDAATVT